MKILLIGENKYNIPYTHGITDKVQPTRAINMLRPDKVIKDNILYKIKTDKEKYKYKDWHLFIITGASCVGKSTCIRRLLEHFNQLQFVITTTTRKKRYSEMKDISYHYTTILNFQDKIKNGDFEEYNILFNNLYGLTKESLSSVKNTNSLGVTDMDIEGALNLKSKYPNNITIIHFMIPTYKFRKEIVSRLYARKNRNASQRKRRIDIEEAYGMYADYRLFNREEEKTVSNLISIIKSKEKELELDKTETT